MKVILSIILGLSITIAFGQHINTPEQALLDKFGRIAYWSEYKGEHDNIDPADSLQKANKVFQNSLLIYASQYFPATNPGMEALKKQGLTIASAEDGLFRIFSWDTRTGGSMHIFYNVYQYRIGKRVFSKLIQDSTEGGDAGFWYSDIYSLTNSGKVYYLAVNHSILSTKDCYDAVNLFCITNNALNDTVKLIKTKTGIRNSLGFEFDFFSVVDHSERPVKLIDYNPATKTLRIPVVLEGGQVTNRSIVYQFTGQYFERVPR